jgi:hypothetical protein
MSRPHFHLAHSPLTTSRIYGALSVLIGLAGYALFLYLRGVYFRTYPPNTTSTAMSVPKVDFVIVFKGASTSLIKAKLRADVNEAEAQYLRLISTLQRGGLQATGRTGASKGQVIVLVSCPQEQIAGLVQRERYNAISYARA